MFLINIMADIEINMPEETNSKTIECVTKKLKQHNEKLSSIRELLGHFTSEFVDEDDVNSYEFETKYGKVVQTYDAQTETTTTITPAMYRCLNYEVIVDMIVTRQEDGTETTTFTKMTERCLRLIRSIEVVDGVIVIQFTDFPKETPDAKVVTTITIDQNSMFGMTYAAYDTTKKPEIEIETAGMNFKEPDARLA